MISYTYKQQMIIYINDKERAALFIHLIINLRIKRTYKQPLKKLLNNCCIYIYLCYKNITHHH